MFFILFGKLYTTKLKLTRLCVVPWRSFQPSILLIQSSGPNYIESPNLVNLNSWTKIKGNCYIPSPNCLVHFPLHIFFFSIFPFSYRKIETYFPSSPTSTSPITLTTTTMHTPMPTVMVFFFFFCRCLIMFANLTGRSLEMHVDFGLCLC